ncbi:MAG: hypothetical protein ACRDKX_05895 [Solirubrobacterales bacterium]
MPGRLRNILLATAVAAILSGCGSDDEGTIPEDASQNLIAQLDAVQASVAAGDCETAQARAEDLSGLVNELPSEVGLETKEALRGAASNLAELTADPTECTAGPTGAQTPTTPTETTEPATTETTTTETDTTKEEDEPEEEPTDQPEEQPAPDEEQPQDEAPGPSDEGPGGGQGGESPSGGLGPGGGGEG